MQKKVDQPPPIGKELMNIPGAESSAKIDAWWGLVFGVIALVVFICLAFPDPYWDMLRFMGDGIRVTITVTIISFVLILVVGLFGALARLSKKSLIKNSATIYVEVIRGIPLMVQLFWWYFAFPAVIRSAGETLQINFLSNFSANANVMAVLGLTICYGAYMTEIYRAGIQSIPKGQMEAARSLGMNYAQAMRYVILPQAFRVILPPVGNEFTALIKDTSLVSVVVVYDMTRRAREFISTNFNPISGWTMLALVYLVLTLLSARVASWLERKVTPASR